MAYLYLDTTDHLAMGLLADNFAWMDFIELGDKKNAGRLHSCIYTLCAKHQLDAKTLAGIFVMAGPGSYTGMRLSEGLAQVMEWQGIPKFSMYHFDIPLFLYETHGIFMSNAYKGEYFFHVWNGMHVQQVLKTVEEIPAFVANHRIDNRIFVSSRHLIADCSWAVRLIQEGISFSSTTEMLREKGQQIFRMLCNNKIQKEIFYYRHLDDEFRSSG